MTEPKLSPIAISTQAAFQRGFQDLNFFARMSIPHVMTHDFPPHYIGIWLMIVSKMREEGRPTMLRFALGLPRGFAKTTFIKVLVCWLICYDYINFALTVCATEPLAQYFVADVHGMLSSPTMEAVYGGWKSNLAIDNKDLKKASYRKRAVNVMAIGANSAVRGLNIDHERPDFIICDDMQTKDNADSDVESLALLQRFVGTILKLADPAGTVAVYSGNMYPMNCILQRLQEHPDWVSLITGCILSDGKSLWEAVHSLKSLYESFRHDEALGLAYIWFAEMMNQPILEHVSLLPNGTIPRATNTIETLAPTNGFIIIDPAGFKTAADDNVIMSALVEQGKPHVARIAAGKFDPGTVISETITQALHFNIRLVFIESIGYQQTLAYWFAKELKRLNLLEHFILVDLSRHNAKKEPAIRVSVQLLLEGKWDIIDDSARQKYVFQALQYKIGKPKQRDDILDTCAYIDQVRAEHWPLVMSTPLGKISEQQGRLVTTTPF